MAAVFDAVGPSSAGASTASGSTLTWSHTCSTAADRLLTVGVAVGNSTSDSMTASVTYAGVTMTSRGKVHCGGGTSGYVQFFSLTAPATGANNVVVTLTAAATISAGSVSFTGANQTTPFGTFVTNADANTSTGPITVNVPSTTSGNPVVDAAAWGSGSLPTAPTAPILKWARATNSSSRAGDGAQSVRTSTGGTVTASYTIANDNWGIVAAEVLPAPTARFGSALAAARIAASSTATGIHAGAPTAVETLAASETGFQTRSVSPPAVPVRLATAVAGGKGGRGSATAAPMLLSAASTCNKVNIGRAVVTLSAAVSDVLHAGMGTTSNTGPALFPSPTLFPSPSLFPSAGAGAALLLTAATSATRDTGVAATALLVLQTSTTATSDRASSATAAALFLSADANTQRVITAIASQILVRPAPTTTYELVAVARVMQPSGPPVFLEVDPIDWTGLSYTEELSKAPQLNAGCQISGLTEPILQRLRKPAELPTELWLRRNGRVVFAGPLFTAQVQGEALTFNAQGALGYLRLMDVNSDLVFANVDQFKIVTGLIDQWANMSYGNFGIDTSNIAPSGVLRDATYLMKELHNVGQRVEELGLRDNGFDIWVDPASRKLQLAYPQRGVDRSSGEDAIVFDERNITSPNVLMSVAPGDVGSEACGTGTGGAGTLYSERANSNMRAQYGRSVLTQTFDGVTEQATLDAHVQGLLDARLTALWVPGPDVRVTPDSDIGAYDVGDTVSYTLHSALSTAGAFRLRKRTVTVSRTGQEAVSVGFV